MATAEPPLTHRRQRLGRFGEAVALRLAVDRGYRVLECRYRCRAGEIDLIAEDGGQLVFVEVKTRGSRSFGRPAAAVHAAKRSRMAQVALHYLNETDGLDRRTRFDVVEIWAENEKIQDSRWWQDAFRLTGGSY